MKTDSLFVDNGSGWFIGPGDSQGNPNANNQVLLLQLSTLDGEGFSGTLPVQGLSGGVPFSAYVSFATTPLCDFFTDMAEFEAFAVSQGKVLVGVEDFEESNIPPGELAQLGEPLGDAPNVDQSTGFGFPDGLAAGGIVIQTNVTQGAGPDDPDRSGDPRALYVIGPQLINASSRKVGEFLITMDDGEWASLDLLLPGVCPWDCGNDDGVVDTVDLLALLAQWGGPGSCDIDGDATVAIRDLLALLGRWGAPEDCAQPTAVGFQLSRFKGFADAGWTVTLFDQNDVRVADFDVPAPGASGPSKVFVGFACETPIGRVNIFDQAGPSLDAVDDIQIWR